MIRHASPFDLEDGDLLSDCGNLYTNELAVRS